MCRMTDTGFRWSAAICVPPVPFTHRWYVYERGPGEHRYSRQNEPEFRPLYAINIKGRSHARN